MAGSSLTRLLGAVSPPAAAGTNYTLTAQGGSYTLTGQSATLLRSKRIVASGGSYTETGGSAIIERDRKLTASGGSYALTGQQVTITKETPAVNYQLTAQGGSYSLSGQNASINRNRSLVASGGDYSLSGQDATLSKNRNLSAQGGEYLLSGQDAEIIKTTISNEGGSGKGKVYIKRGDRILVFSTPQQAQAYIDAEKAIEAVKPKQYPKKKKKKAEPTIKEPLTVEPEEVISIDYVRLILEQYSIPLPSVDKYEINALMAIYNQALHINEINRINREIEEDEDDIEVLLLMEA